VGFEPTIPVFERTKTVNALDSAAAVIGAISTEKIIYRQIVIEDGSDKNYFKITLKIQSKPQNCSAGLADVK
jgi:hypothetical protein